MKNQEKALAIGAIIAGMAAAWYLMQKKALSEVLSAPTADNGGLVMSIAGQWVTPEENARINASLIPGKFY